MIDFKVVPDNGEPFEVNADSRDVYVWEKKRRDGRKLHHLMEDLAMEDMYEVAHIASKRTGKFDGTLQEFTRECVLVFEVTDEADPTRPDLSDEPSSP